MIISMDHPAHSRLRKLAAGAFTLRRVEQMRERVQQVVDELLDEMAAKGSPGDEAKAFVRQEPAELLSDLTREQLLALVTKLLREHPDLYEWVEAALTLPTPSGKAKSITAKRKQVDTAVYQRRVRSIMHSLDHMRVCLRLTGTSAVWSES